MPTNQPHYTPFVAQYDHRPVLHLVNPQSGPARYREQKWLFSFGAYGTTHLLVWDRYLEGALETAAEWLAENAPGQLIAHDSPELWDLYEEACAEAGHDTSEDSSDIDPECWDAATTGLTYTEAGYIPSWEWWVRETDRDELANFRLQYTP